MDIQRPRFRMLNPTKNVFSEKKNKTLKYRKSLFFSSLLLNVYGYKASVSCKISWSRRWTAARSSRCKEWSPRRLLVSGRYCLNYRPTHKKRQTPQRDFVMSAERRGEWTADRTLLWQVRGVGAIVHTRLTYHYIINNCVERSGLYWFH